MTARPVFCPICNTPLRGSGSVCPDCGEDLSPVVYLQNEAAILYNRALRLARQDLLAQAIPLLEHSLQLDDSAVQSLSLLGKLYSRQGDYSKAEEAWQRAKELEPDSEEILQGVAFVQEAIRSEADRKVSSRRRDSLRRWSSVLLAFLLGAAFGIGGVWIRAEFFAPEKTVAVSPSPEDDVALVVVSPTHSPTPPASPTPREIQPKATIAPTATETPEATPSAMPSATPTKAAPTSSEVIPTPSATMTPTATPDLVTPARIALAEAFPNRTSIEVRQQGSIVVLEGTVSSLIERYRLETAIRSVQGVESVDMADVTIGSAYVVQSGDTLWAISDALYGDAAYWPLIAEENGIQPPHLIVAGQTLSVPMP